MAFVKFTTQEALDSALELNNSEHMGRYIEISIPQPRGQGGERGGSFGGGFAGKGGNGNAAGGDNAESSTCFIGNLSYNTTAESLKEAFASVGEIIDARIAYDKESGRVNIYPIHIINLNS